MSRKAGKRLFFAAVALATLLKIYCAATTYGTNDTGLFQLYGQALYENGLEETYKASQHFNHTPALSCLLIALYWVTTTFSWSFPLVLRLPGIAADVVTCIFLSRLISRDSSTGLSWNWGILFALNPVAFMVSGYHGNFDSVIAMFVFLAAYYAFRDRIDLCAFCFALAVHVKVAPLILTPVFFFFWMRRGKGMRFSIIVSALLLSVWLFPLIRFPGVFLHNVFGYGSYWGIWGITYWLRQTGYAPFHLVSFYSLNPLQEKIMTGLKIVVIAGIVALAWFQRSRNTRSIFATVSYSFAIFFAFAPGVLLHYLAWPSCFALLHARRWCLILLTASSVFLFRCYSVINHGFPWDKGLFTVHVLDRWIAWSNLPWIAYTAFLASFLFAKITVRRRTSHRRPDFSYQLDGA
jgi:hypothetical protein